MTDWLVGQLRGYGTFTRLPDCKQDVASYIIPTPQHHGSPATMDCSPSNLSQKVFPPFSNYSHGDEKSLWSGIC